YGLGGYDGVAHWRSLQDPILLETGKETGRAEIWHLSSHWKNQRYITEVQTTPITVQCRIGVRIEDNAGFLFLDEK
ncbi:MAG: hypothetical protein ABSF13_12755, partial [Smithella sp.]